jgi:hypothetical protein
VALEDKILNYDNAMTALLKDELITLHAQSKSTARQAAERMIDKTLHIDRRKHTDIGLYDGFVTPALAPGVCNDPLPISLPVPTLDEVHKYGFAVNLEIQPREFEGGKILSIIYPEGSSKTVRPAEHLPIVMHYIEKDATKKGYTIVPSEKPQVLVSAK